MLTFEKHYALFVPTSFFEETQVNGVRANGVERTRVHKSKSPRQFRLLEFCFPSFPLDGIEAPQLQQLEPVGHPLV